MKSALKKALKKIIDILVALIVFLKYGGGFRLKNHKYYPYAEFIIERRGYLYYVFIFLFFFWLYGVYNTSGMFSERRGSSIELFSIDFVKKTENKVEWMLNADKLIKDDSYNKNYFTNIKFTTDPASDSVQLITSKEAVHDANLKIINFSGNVHVKSIYPDTSENVIDNSAPASGAFTRNRETAPVNFFERGRPEKFLEDNMYTDSLEYYYENQVLIARNPVKIVRPTLEISGNSLENRVKEKKVRIAGSVRIKIYE